MIKISQVPKYNKNHQKLKIAIVKSGYHKDITDSLEKECKVSLTTSGIKINNISTFEVPGAWEIPIITQKLALSKEFDGIIALGVIVKGETYHFEILSNECARALMEISLKFNTPITFEILTVYSLEQARKRSSGKYNKGKEAAVTLLSTIKALNEV